MQLPGFGIQTAALVEWCNTSSSFPYTGNKALVEEYDGSSWSQLNNLGTAGISNRFSLFWNPNCRSNCRRNLAPTRYNLEEVGHLKNTDGTNWRSAGTDPNRTRCTEK